MELLLPAGHFDEERKRIKRILKEKLPFDEKIKKIRLIVYTLDEKVDELPNDLDEIFWILQDHDSLSQKLERIMLLI